ncbi:MAG TPA: DinB family protein [Granulicella sp.]
MSNSAVPAEALLHWNDESARGWLALLAEQPEIMALPCDVRNSGDVAHTFQHIFAVELRYAQRLAAVTESPYEDVPFGSSQELAHTHEQAMQMIRTLLADSAYDWSTEIEFVTITAGRLRATRQNVLLHMLLHSIRHYAQLATLIRQHGYKTWPMDYLYTACTPL